MSYGYTPFFLFRASMLPRSGYFFNAIAFFALSILGIAVFFAGLTPWGGIINAAGWAGIIIVLPLLILWFILSRISGILNAVVMIIICWSGFTGKDGAVNHTVNIHDVAVFIRVDGSSLNGIMTELGGYMKYNPDQGGDIDVDLLQDYRSELEHSWNNYGTFVNPWYTPEKFTEVWQAFYTWFSDHKYLKTNPDGTSVPPVVPYMGSLDRIKKMQTYGWYSDNDSHHGTKVLIQPPKEEPPDPKVVQNDWIIENGATREEREQAWITKYPNAWGGFNHFYQSDKITHPQDYDFSGDPKEHRPVPKGY